MAVIPMLDAINKARKALERTPPGDVVQSFRMVAGDGQDLGVVAHTKRRDACALDVMHALIAIYRKRKGAEPPPGWTFVFAGLSRNG